MPRPRRSATRDTESCEARTAARGSRQQRRFPEGCDSNVAVIGAYGYAAELSTGKDTPSGHWEMAGVPVLYEWGYFREPAEHISESAARRC